MNHWQNLFYSLAVWGLLIPTVGSWSGLQVFGQKALGQEMAEELAEYAGADDLNEAMRLRVDGTGLRNLNQVISRLELAIDKGLDDEDKQFAEQMLADSLMERASTLMQVINARSIRDQRVQKIRGQVTSDLRRVIGYDDPLPNAYLMLGKLMAMPGGDPHEARRSIDNYLKSEDLATEQHAEALVLRASLLRDKTKALADMQAAIELAPGNMGYRLARALFLRRSDKLDEAHVAIDEILRLEPENANAHVMQGEIFRQQDRLEEALTSFDQATQLAPQAPGPFQNRGEIYHQQKKFTEAIAQFNEVLKLQPGVLLTLLHRANAYQENNQLPEALTDIEVVIEKQPIVTAHRLRAAILLKMDRIDEAIEEMERVAAAMSDQPELKMQLALYYLVNKQPSKAITAYSEVLDQNSEFFQALQARGDAYLNIGKHAEAIADFQRALKLQPENTTLLNNLAWVLATSPEDELRDGKLAVELATKACEMTDYKTPHILSTLAAAFAENGDFDSAIKWSQKSVDLDDPEHGEQLVKELKSYRQQQPWREKQSLEESEPQPPLVDTPQTPPTSTGVEIRN